MRHHLNQTPALRRVIASLLIALQLVGTMAPVIYAQSDEGTSAPPLYLPLLTTTDTESAPILSPIELYRTQVAPQTAAQWRDLVTLGVTVLQRSEDKVLVLADDQQLAALAQWGYQPAQTTKFSTLVHTAEQTGFALADSFTPLMDTLAVAAEVGIADVAALDAARTTLQNQITTLVAEQISLLAQLAATDSDNDGLTDDQEGFWCTDANKADSDGDGFDDGEEIRRLKAWIKNETWEPPSSGKPFQGWPAQKVDCFDDDFDSVPDAAEQNELGLNANRESTDRDKFDDGQELFGATYCPGQAGACSYGLLPRTVDANLVFSEMPNWVESPGNHPLVAAFPIPTIEVVPSSFHVQTVTTLTTDRTFTEGTEKSYNTTDTEGHSQSVAETETWNNWQESTESRETLEGVAQMASVSANSGNPNTMSSSDSVYAAKQRIADECTDIAKMKLYGDSLTAGGEGGVNYLIYEGKLHASYSDQRQSSTTTSQNMESTNPDCSVAKASYCAIVGSDHPYCKDETINVHLTDDSRLSVELANMDSLVGGLAGVQLAQTQAGQLIGLRLEEIAYTLSRPRITHSESRGSSYGGARTVTNEVYSERAVTNGQAWGTSEAWGNATAIDTAHTADFWFTYEVSNQGTEYAREIANLAFNIYIGDDPNPAYSYFVAPDLGGSGKFETFMPTHSSTYTSRKIPLNLAQMRAIDLGAPVRVMVEDYSYGIDELFYQDALSAGLMLALDDGAADGNLTLDYYLIPTWGNETVLQVLARYFPHETDLDGNLTAVWTPEYRSDTPSWCVEARHPTDQPSQAVWCKHTLSTGEWWNVYADGLGTDGEGYENTPAIPGATALFRFNQDRDLDGYSDRSEELFGTDPTDGSSFPFPELIAGIHSVRSGNQVKSTLSLLNLGIHDAYGVEAIMVAPDDSINVTLPIVGGSGRVRGQKQVIAGSQLTLQTPLPSPWLQNAHALPAVGGYYTGSNIRTYTFTVNCGAGGGCAVGSGDWSLTWSDGQGNNGSLDFDAGYVAPTLRPVGTLGLKLALNTGSVANGEKFTVEAAPPADLFQYTINREPYTEPLVVVSYNDPQGNHRFVIPPAAMQLSSTTENLQQFAGEMLYNLKVDIETSAPLSSGANNVRILVNNVSDKTLQDAQVLLVTRNISDTTVAQSKVTADLPPGPSYVAMQVNTGAFSPSYKPQEPYLTQVFLYDYQNHLIDSTGRPLASFQADPRPQMVVESSELTWNFGSAAKGTLLQHPLSIANLGYGPLYTYLPPTEGLTIVGPDSRAVGSAGQTTYQLMLRTADLPVGAYNRTVTLTTNDPTNPTRSLHIQGTITAAPADTPGGLQRPLDVAATVQGPKSSGEWVEFTHDLGLDAASLHPVNLYSQDYSTLYGVGKYATDFGVGGTASYEMFGNGADGPLTISVDTTDSPIDSTCTGTAGTAVLAATNAGFAPGQVILIHQSQGTNAGTWMQNKIVGYTEGSITLAQPLNANYTTGAQVLVLKQYTNVTVNPGVTWTSKAWNGTTGGILAFLASDTVTINGSISASGTTGLSTTSAPNTPAGGVGGGFRGGSGRRIDSAGTATQGESILGLGASSNSASGNGGGAGTCNTTTSDPIAGGGGGSHTAGGATGTVNDPSGATSGPKASGGIGATSTYGSADLTTMVFGGGGGGGAMCGPSNGSKTTYGGNSGGGIIVIAGANISISGGVTANGGSYGSSLAMFGGGGSGAGGSILLKTQSAILGTGLVSAQGGATSYSTVGPNQSSGGAGGDGRIHIEFCESVSGTTNPSANTEKLSCYRVEQVESSPYTSGRLNLPEEVTTSATYKVQYGRKIDFGAAGTSVTTLRVPAGIANNVTLDALLSGVGTGNVTLRLDVGNNGTWDWESTQSVSDAALFSSVDLAATLNDYWQDNDAPTSGTLDVPIKVSLSKAGQVLLTNLQLTSASSQLRTVRLGTQPYDDFKLDFTITGSGNVSLTVGIDIGNNGSLDWTGNASAALPYRLFTGDLSDALNAYLSDKSGKVNVPIRFYLSPQGTIKLNSIAATYGPLTDLANTNFSATNNAVSVAASGAATADIQAAEGDTVNLQTTVRNSGSRASGPLTVAFFADVPGWGTWYLGGKFIANLAPNASQVVEIAWNTSNYWGDMTIRAVVNPYGRVPEADDDTDNNTNAITAQITPLNPPPVAAFTATPTLGGKPLTVQFTSNSTGSITGYLWDFGDGTTSTAQNPSHEYGQVGVYPVTLTTTGPSGDDILRKEAYIQVTNAAVPPIAAFSANQRQGVAPLTVAFTNSSTGSITGYLWDFGDSKTSTQTSPSHTYTSPGTYTVKLTASGPGGSDAETKSAYVVVTEAVVEPAAPVAMFSATPLQGTAPLSVKFSDASTGTINTRLWDFGDDSTSTQSSPSHTYTQPGTYTVKLTVGGPGGEDVETKSALIVVTAPTGGVEPPVAAFTAEPLQGTAPLRVEFSDASTSSITVRNWDFGDGNGSTVTNPVYTYTVPGTYTVTLTVSGPGGDDTETKTNYVQVEASPGDVTARFRVSATQGEAPLTVQFTDESDGEVLSWAWEFGSAGISDEQDPRFTFTAAGIYEVKLTVTGAADAQNSTTQTIVVTEVGETDMDQLYLPDVAP